MSWPKTPPEFPETLARDELSSCSYEAHAKERRILEDFRDECRRCNRLRTEKGLEKILSLAGQKGF
jgi:hypothetical protein